MTNQKGNFLPIVIAAVLVTVVGAFVAYKNLGNKLPLVSAPTLATKQEAPAEKFEPITQTKAAPKEIDNTALNELDQAMLEVDKITPSDNLTDLEL